MPILIHAGSIKWSKDGSIELHLSNQAADFLLERGTPESEADP